MTEPTIRQLSLEKRSRFFWFLFGVFCMTLPLLILYTTGHRLSFDGDASTPNIVTTGGMYISVLDESADIYVDEALTRGSRLFRSATYIQNINAGMHRIHVQRDGAYTWVKELPVESQIVIEAGAFNMPEMPQLRPITKYETANGEMAFLSDETTATYFTDATSTERYVVASTSRAQRALVLNEEYDFVASLFAATTTDTRSLWERYTAGQQRFGFSTTSSRAATNTPPVAGDTVLVERDGELYARYIGDAKRLPYYYCIVNYDASTTAALYGEHVAKAFTYYRSSTTTPLVYQEGRVCRQEIRLDRHWQDVLWYGFFPGSSDLVLMQLEDGLYVTEIDDRAWQNTQLLYPGKGFKTLIESNTIYLKMDDTFFELVPEIAQN